MVARDNGHAEAAHHAKHLLFGCVGMLLMVRSVDTARSAAFHWVAGTFIVFWMAYTVRAWAKMSKSSRAAQEVEARRRLKEALALPGGDGQGLSEEWFESASRAAWTVGVSILAAVIAAAAALFALAYPAAGVDYAGEKLTAFWHFLLANYSHTAIFTGGYLVAHFLLFWVCSAFNAVIDLWRPASLEPFRLHADHDVTVCSLVKASAVALFNQFLTLLPHLFGTGLIESWCPDMFSAELPSLAELAVSQVAFMCVSEPFFYFTHRFLHTDFGFKYVHYIHHEIMKPSSVYAIYAHPLEHLGSVTPFFLAGPLLFRAHVTLWWVWYANRTLQSCVAHMSVALPWVGSNMFHSYHHQEAPGPEGYQNLGFNTGILDTFCGTDTFYRERTWQARVDKTYTDASFPVDKVLAQRGLMDEEAAEV